MLHIKVLPDSDETNVNVALVWLLREAGLDVTVVSGGVVSARTVQL
jgi:hypothetical protein